MKELSTDSKWKLLRNELFSPWPGGLKSGPFSLRQYVLDLPTRNREAIAFRNRISHEKGISQQELHIGRPEPQVAAKQPRKLAVETWESEGGATPLKSPRAD